MIRLSIKYNSCLRDRGTKQNGTEVLNYLPAWSLLSSLRPQGMDPAELCEGVWTLTEAPKLGMDPVEFCECVSTTHWGPKTAYQCGPLLPGLNTTGHGPFWVLSSAERWISLFLMLQPICACARYTWCYWSLTADSETPMTLFLHCPEYGGGGGGG